MAITSWTDEGMNWENPDLNKPEYIEALYQALLERVAVFGSYFLFTSPWEQKNFGGMIRKTSVLWNLQNFMENLYPYFIDTAQDIPEGSESFPHWTWESLLEAAGIDDFVQPQANVLNNNLWGINMYKIINLLDTFGVNSFDYDCMHRDGGISRFDYGGDPQESWDEFIGNFQESWNSREWSGSNNLNIVKKLHLYGISDWYASAERSYGKVSPNLSFLNNYIGNIEVSLYGKTLVNNDFDYIGVSIDTYDKEAAGVPEGHYKFIGTRNISSPFSEPEWFDVVAADSSLPYSDLIPSSVPEVQESPTGQGNPGHIIYPDIFKRWGYESFTAIINLNFDFSNS